MVGRRRTHIGRSTSVTSRSQVAQNQSVAQGLYWVAFFDRLQHTICADVMRIAALILGSVLTACAQPHDSQLGPAPIASPAPSNEQCAPDASSRYEVRARHIGVIAYAAGSNQVKEATPEELQAAYARVARAKAELAGGRSYEAVWAAYADPKTAVGTKDGDLGYFKRGVMLPQIEKQAFCLPVGVISPIIRTVFGYHLVQVTEVRPAPPYAEIIARAIKANITIQHLPVDNAAAEVLVRVSPSGAVMNAKVVRSSGNVEWDEAVVKAVYRTSKLPLDVDGRIPGEMDLVFRPH